MGGECRPPTGVVFTPLGGGCKSITGYEVGLLWAIQCLCENDSHVGLAD